VRSLSKRSAIVALVGGIIVGLSMFIAGSSDQLSFLREMVWIFPSTAVSTIVFLAIGSKVFQDNPDERKEVEKWMDGLTCR
jgi:lipopolysaccharide export LptBFGC system permease protein LptF